MQPVKFMPMQIPFYRGCVWDLLPTTEILSKTQVQVSAMSLKNSNQAGKSRNAQEPLYRERRYVFKLLFLDAK